MLTIDEIIQAIQCIMRDQISSTDKIEQIRNFIDGLGEDHK
jgi:hypothetical protein